MKDSEVYLRAAEIVECGHQKWPVGGYSCFALDAAYSDFVGTRRREDAPQRKAYEKLFMPRSAEYAWGDAWREDAPACRVLALLFMHQIALDEERTARTRK